jgi:hypothetical protein
MYSGVMVCGEAMVQVSIALLVVPLLVLISVPLYIVILYRPARKARNKRLEIKKNDWNESETTRPALISKRECDMSVDGSFRAIFKKISAPSMRVLKHFYTYIQSVIVHCSRDGHEQQSLLKRSKLNAWQAMNMPPYAQGYHHYHNDKDDIDDWKIDKNHSGSFRPPEEIANMLPSAKLKEYYMNERNKNQSGGIFDDVQGSISEPKRPHKINNKSNINPTSIVFEFHEACSVIRSKLFAVNASPLISIKDISRGFENIWEVFYPDGVVVTETERQEFLELFNLWMFGDEDEDGQALLQMDVFDNSVLTTVKVISFDVFEDWFMNDFSQRIRIRKSDRVLDHILRTRQPKKRGNTTESELMSISSNSSDDVYVDCTN